MESRTTPGSSEYTDFDGMEPGVCNENLRNNGYRISPKGGNGSKIHRMAKDDSRYVKSGIVGYLRCIGYSPWFTAAYNLVRLRRVSVQPA